MDPCLLQTQRGVRINLAQPQLQLPKATSVAFSLAIGFTGWPHCIVKNRHRSFDLGLKVTDFLLQRLTFTVQGRAL